MSNSIAVIRGWNSVLNEYLYWSVSQILDPFLEYPVGYPSYTDITEVCILDYQEQITQPVGFIPDIQVLWDTGLTDGYAVSVNASGVAIRCPNANHPLTGFL
jgi:hypothetical protein